MGSVLSTIFSLAHRFNALKLRKNVLPQDLELNYSVETVVVPVVQEADDHNLAKPTTVEMNRDPVSQAPAPQIEPNSFQYKQPLSKRKSKPELRVYCPLSESGANLIVHEFIWKYGGKQVFLAGNFNNWTSNEIELIPTDASSEYHRVQVELDPSRTWEFKFIVDGVWRCNLDIPTTTDSHGNTNNVIYPE